MNQFGGNLVENPVFLTLSSGYGPSNLQKLTVPYQHLTEPGLSFGSASLKRLEGLFCGDLPQDVA